MTSQISHSQDIHLSSFHSKVAKKLKALNLVVFALSVIGLITVTVASGIGLGLAFNPLLLILIGIGLLIIASSLGLTYLIHKIKIRELQPPLVIRTFSKEETEAFFEENFVLHTPPKSRDEGPSELVNVQIEQAGHSARRSYKVAGSRILLHCLQGDPSLVSMKCANKQQSMLWGYLRPDTTPINQQLDEILSTAVTPELWQLSKPELWENNLIQEGSTRVIDLAASSDHVNKVGNQKEDVCITKKWKNLGQLILPSPEDYGDRLEDAFLSAKRAFSKAILQSKSLRCNIATLPLPLFDEQEYGPKWDSMIQRALLEAIQDVGASLPLLGLGLHIVVIHPNQEPFLYPFQ